jgi:hypothetical protein
MTRPTVHELARLQGSSMTGLVLVDGFQASIDQAGQRK